MAAYFGGIMKRPAKRSIQLSDSLHKQLNAYALAASAAGAGLLALVQPAEAKIIYTPVHHVVGRNARYKVDLNHDKIGDLALVNTYGCNRDYCDDALSAIAFAGNGVEGRYSVAYALQPGAQIGPKQPFSGKIMAQSSSSFGTFGQWLNISNGYLGVKFNIKGKAHYGWLRLSVQVLGHAKMVTTLTGYAYETIPNKAIIAGKTHGKGDDTLGRLAQGASGLRQDK
jgi:hypothetical protein